MSAAPDSTGPPGAHAHRVIFVDLARALAVFFMMYGHTVAALLAPEYQQGTWYDVWQFQRGLTSSLFLLLGGFAFSLAARRHWVPQADTRSAVIKRLRRFALFVLLGYSLHLPVYRLLDLPFATPENWRMFQAVDVLQLVGVTLIVLQLLALVSRSRRVFMVLSFVLALVVVFVTGPALRIDWTARVSAWVAPYLSTATGSLFPLLPWSAFVLAGAGLGQIYSLWGAAHLGAFARWVLLVPGAVLLALAFVSQVLPYPQFLGNPFAWPPTEFAIRTGPCLIIMAPDCHGQPAHPAPAAGVRRHRAGIAAGLLRPPLHRLRFGVEQRAPPLLRRVARPDGDAGGGDLRRGLDDRTGAGVEPRQAHRPRTAKRIAWVTGVVLVIWLIVRPM